MSEGGLNKSERLINLTMALLATKRFLTKNQIFQSVEGYQGSPETKERMFERDKTDLRLLGLEIEVGTDDPFFEDEAGYRINPDSYSLQISDLDQEDLALLSIAARQWQGSLFATQGQSALRKIEGLHGALNTEVLDLPFIQRENPEKLLEEIWDSIDKSLELTFNYRSTTITARHIAPLGLILSRGYWYLISHDFDRDALRSFKVSRIDPTSLKVGRRHSIQFSGDISHFLQGSQSESDLIDGKVLVRKGRAQEVRALAEATPFDPDWDLIEVKSISKAELFERVARSTTSAKIIEPEELTKDFIQWIAGKINE